jgi:hypothetical protein
MKFNQMNRDVCLLLVQMAGIIYLGKNKKTITLGCIQYKGLSMWVIVECEFDYNNLDHMEIYGPFENEERAIEEHSKWMKNKRSYQEYYIKRVNDLT